jgi:hypothetical protein
MTNVGAAEPRIIARQRGGYLALSTSGPRIGVAADTEDGAKALFYSTAARWREILDGKPGDEMTQPATGRPESFGPEI